MTNISNESIVFQLGERYKALQIIRERAQNTSVWLLSIFTTGSGYLIQSKIAMNEWQKLFLSFIVVVFYLLIRFYFLGDLEKGFKLQQKVAVVLEKRLGLYDKTDSILPTEWKKAGTKQTKGNFFNSVYLMVSLGTLIMLLGIIFQGHL